MLAWLNRSKHPPQCPHPTAGTLGSGWQGGFGERGTFLLSPQPAFIGLSFIL